MSRALARPRTIALLALTVASLVAGFIGVGPTPWHSEGGTALAAETSTDPLKDMVDAFLVEEDGGWFCPHNPLIESSAVCPEDVGQGGTSQEFAERLIEDIVAHPELDPPMYARVGKARNDCSLTSGPSCTTGVPPDPGVACLDPYLPPDQYRVDSPYCALKGLVDVGVKLGVIVGAATDEINGVKYARSVEELTYHACRINEADSSNLYDFMFLDLAFKLQDADLQDVVQKIENGRYWNPDDGQYEDCPAGGWPHLITNDTTYPQRTLQTGAWGHAKKFAILDGADWQTQADAAANGNTSVLTSVDTDFIHDVHNLDPGSHPVLRLEVPSESSRFATLTGEDQCSLLRRWAKQQKQSPDPVDHFSIIYPMYVHALPETGKDQTYDSFFRGTFLHQRELIHFYNPDVTPLSLSGCPQPPS